MFVRDIALLAGENLPREGLCNVTEAHMGMECDVKGCARQ